MRQNGTESRIDRKFVMSRY